jgi:hypothetical protein
MTEWGPSFFHEEELRCKGSTLKFDYDFKNDTEKVYICYCIPYTYTKLFKFLGTLHDQDNICEILREDILCRSESGVDVP